MTSREERADRAESEMLDRCAETVVHLQGTQEGRAARIERRGEAVVITAYFGERVYIDERHIRLAAMALGLAVVPASKSATESARAEAMGGRS